VKHVSYRSSGAGTEPCLLPVTVRNEAPSSNRSPVRTEVVDRSSEKANKQRNKDHISKIEKTLSCLQSQFSSMPGALYEIQLRVAQSSTHSTLGSTDMTYEPRASPAVAGGESSVGFQ
jgi:hypothetical protein